MDENLKDVIVSIASDNTAQLESWLLGHGFLPGRSSHSADGRVTYYAVKDISPEGRADLKLIGADIAQAWKPGERQSD